MTVINKAVRTISTFLVISFALFAIANHIEGSSKQIVEEFYQIVDSETSVEKISSKLGNPIKVDQGQSLVRTSEEPKLLNVKEKIANVYYWAPSSDSIVVYVILDVAGKVIQRGHLKVD